MSDDLRSRLLRAAGRVKRAELEDLLREAADALRPRYGTTDAEWLRGLARDLAQGRVIGMESICRDFLPSQNMQLFAWAPQRLREIADSLEASGR